MTAETKDRVQRANRPTHEFLEKVGLNYIPPEVDLSFYDGHTVGDSTTRKATYFIIRVFNEAGEIADEDTVDAHQHPGNAEDQIYCNLREKLVSLGARPL